MDADTLNQALTERAVVVRSIDDGAPAQVSGAQLVEALSTDPFWQDIAASTEQPDVIARILDGWPSPGVNVLGHGLIYFRLT